MSERVRVPDLIRMYKRGEKIAMLTAYDYTFARLFDEAGVPVLLVGDSLGVVVQGGSDTLSVTFDEVVYHAKLVARAARQAFVVGDLPFMSYQLGWRQALKSAGRLVKESGVSSIKLEGGDAVQESVYKIVQAGIPVMGHLGLTPQSVHMLGGNKVQGRTHEEGRRLIEQAIGLEQAGAFSLVLEAVPAELGREITQAINIPTIGIGAGPHCSGQVLVMHDLLGFSFFEGGKKPKFVKCYRNLAQEVVDAVKEYCSDVSEGRFPAPEHCYERPHIVHESIPRQTH